MQKNLAPSDEALVSRAQLGEKDAFTELYRRHLPGVYAWVRFKVPEEEVEDITQEIFIAMMKSLDNFRGQSKFSTWLRSLTGHKIADYYRSNNYRFARNSDGEEAVEKNSGNRERFQNFLNSPQDDLITIKKALGDLPENYQEILLLRFVDDVPFNEIAQQKGQSLDATKSLFRRSVAALRKAMADNDE
jgi:RNA polymerase sigma-70 factor, ECF subfamily